MARLAGDDGDLSVRAEPQLREARTAVLTVPSAVIPRERNVILNPAHADFRRIVIQTPEPFSFDPRLWTARG
jgi:RES domain-containing protein